MKYFATFLAIVFCIHMETHVKADVIYDNFGSGDSYNTSSGESFGLSGSTYRERGPSFTPQGNFTLDSVDTAIRRNSGSAFFHLDLYDSGATGRPESVLESASAFGSDQVGQLTTFNFSGSTLLLSGETYFLIVRPNSSSASGNWNFNPDSNVRGIGGLRTNGGNWTLVNSIEVAFRVNGTVATVPEPGSSLCLFVVVSIVALRRRVAHQS